MNKLIFTLIASLFLVSCKDNTPKQDFILLSGKITDSKFSELRLISKDRSSDVQTITLDENGVFSDTITAGTGEYIFYDSRNRIDLYLINGCDFKLNIDGKNFRNSATITGEGSETSNYLINKYRRMSEIMGYENASDFYSIPEGEFKAKSKMIEVGLNTYLDSFPNIPEDFLKTQRKALHYDNMLNLANYESRHKQYTEQPDFKVSEGFLDEVQNIDFSNEEDYKKISSYKRLVTWHHKKSIDELAAKEGIDIHLAKLKVYGAISNEFIRNNLLNSVASMGISMTKDIDEFYNYFISVSKSTRNNEAIKKEYEALKKLSEGNPSPIFTDYINHAGGKTSLEDLKGKYVYIDVWATWCGPCLKELPHLKKLEEKYHNKNIQFLSISVDNDKAYEKWKEMVKDKDMGGIQLFAEDSWNSTFISEYKIKGIPRFILLDPDNNIISSSAPRPSDPKLISLFNELEI